MAFEQLTVNHYDEDVTLCKRITLAGHKISIVAADMEDISVNGRSRRRITVLMDDGGATELVVDHEALEKIERAVGSFYLGD